MLAPGLSIGLAVLGWGAMSIAIGRLFSMVAVVVLEFAVTRTSPRFGWNSSVAASGLRFGLPLSLAGLLSLTLLSIDNVMVGRLQGSPRWGSTRWPSTSPRGRARSIGTAVRAVAMPAFAQQRDAAGRIDERLLVRGSTLVWAAAVPVSVCLGASSRHPVVAILYGAPGAGAASVLSWLAVLGGLRILIDVWVAYLTAAGRSGLLLGCQAVWLAALAPTMWWAVGAHGLEGAGAAHLVVVVAVVVPTFLVALRLAGVGVGAVVLPLLVPLLAAVPAAGAGLLTMRLTDEPWMQLIAGGSVIAGVYLALVGRWARRLAVVERPPRHRATATTGPAPTELAPAGRAEPLGGRAHASTGARKERR